MNAIVTKQANQALSGPEQPPIPVSESAAIFQIIERAARDPSVDIDKMQRLMDMQEKMQASRARTAYAEDFAAMQPHLPIIPEHGKGHNNASYALWEDVNELIKPVLSQFGFGLSFKVKDAQGGVEITAVCTHREGHSDETSKTFPVDTSGNKNAIQAQGSTISYGKRYTATALLNLTSRLEKDDDGKNGGGKAIDPVQPPAKSSASLKRKDENGEDAWDRLIKELHKDFEDCHSLVTLAKLRADYREKARDARWTRAWLDALANEFDAFEDKLPKVDDGDFPGDMPNSYVGAFRAG